MTNPRTQRDVALEEEMVKKQEEAEKTLAGVFKGPESQSDVCTGACKLSRTQTEELRGERKRTVSALELHVHDNKSGGRGRYC